MAATATTIPAPVGRARWTRLIPVAIIVYIISFMDRTNIGFAFDGMGKDLHLDSAAKGLAGGSSSSATWCCRYPADTWPNGGARRSSSGS